MPHDREIFPAKCLPHPVALPEWAIVGGPKSLALRHDLASGTNRENFHFHLGTASLCDNGSLVEPAAMNRTLVTNENTAR